MWSRTTAFLQGINEWVIKPIAAYVGHVFTDAETKALAIPLTGIVASAMAQDAAPEDGASESSVIGAVIAWQVMAIVGMVTQHYLIGRRAVLSDDQDAEIGGEEAAPKMTALLMVNTLNEAADGLLAGLALGPHPTSTFQWVKSIGAAAVLAIGKGAIYASSDAPAAFEAFRHSAEGAGSASLYRQAGVQFFYRHIAVVAMALRELYPVAIGGLHAFSLYTQAERFGVPADASGIEGWAYKAALALPVLFVYSGSALYANRFKVRQMATRLPEDHSIETNSVLVRSDKPLVVRGLGHALHGTWIQKLPTNVALGLAGTANAIGLAALTSKGVETYVGSDLTDRVKTGDAGILMAWIEGADKAAKHGAPIVKTGLALGAALGVGQTAGMTPFVRQQITNTEHPGGGYGTVDSDEERGETPQA